MLKVEKDLKGIEILRWNVYVRHKNHPVMTMNSSSTFSRFLFFTFVDGDFLFKVGTFQAFFLVIELNPNS